MPVMAFIEEGTYFPLTKHDGWRVTHDATLKMVDDAIVKSFKSLD
jgi:hypothetical protein